MFRHYKEMLLVAFSVIIHNIPEGMAVEVSVISSVYTGLLVAIAIGVQDIPEGLAVFLSYYNATGNKTQTLFLGVFQWIHGVFCSTYSMGHNTVLRRIHKYYTTIPYDLLSNRNNIRSHS